MGPSWAGVICILVEILRHSVALSPLSTAVGQNFKCRVWIRQQLTNKQSLHQGATQYHCQLVPSALRSCNLCQAIPQSSFHTQISCNLYFLLISAAIFIVCILYPIHTTASAECKYFSTTVYKCDAPLFKSNCFIYLISYTTETLLVLNFCHYAVAIDASIPTQFSSFKAVTLEHIQKANVYMGACFPLL